MKKPVDEGIKLVREVRERISAEFGDDPRKLFQHFIEMQEQYRHRFVEMTPAGQRFRPEDEAGRE